MVLKNLHAGEELVEMRRDDVLQRDEALVANSDESGQRRRNLDSREQLSAGDRILHDDGKIEREAADIGKRMRWIDGEGGQDREELSVEKGIHCPALWLGERFPPQQMNAGVAERGKNIVAKGVRMLALELMGALPDVLEDFSRSEPAGRPNCYPGGDPPLESGDPHHEELVEIACEDGEEFRPLEARKLLVLRELEYPLVECQPGKFTVEESVCGQALSLHLTMLPQPGERLPTNRGSE